MRKVIVKASVEYAILIGRGILGQLGEEVKKRIQPCKAAIITDTTVEKLYAEKIESSLREAGFTTCRFVYPAGEQSKHIGTLSDILEFLAEEEMTRQDIIIALGGGVCGDMAGFAAAVYQRGIRFVQVPTTFLAAVDSSVGGKTAIDLKAGKNMAGAFYQPHLVLCDVDMLDTLPEEVFADGIAETLKYGIIGDMELFEKTATGTFRNDLEEIIETCVKMKRDIVMEDEFDTGVRQLLNLGHTLGHAIEKKSGFAISHGHAVAIGMHLIAKAAEEKGMAEKGLAEKIRKALENNRLPVSIGYSAEEIAEGALKDKKRRGGEISFVFPEKIGHCEIVKVPVAEVTKLIEKALK
ncbi:MAG: 3-dehydroquinate synthase [Anaerotignum sp.]|nr:3-dehydroquinate synthase [Anaerotignum sp.]